MRSNQASNNKQQQQSEQQLETNSNFRYKIIIEYDGTKYIGWQRQGGVGPSIQAAIEQALMQICQQETTIYGAGRTDAGVHALGQVAHFDTQKQYCEYQLLTGLNHYLRVQGDNITIIKVEEKPNFHARFDAVIRHYRYEILNSTAPSALESNRVWYIPTTIKTPQLDDLSMKKAADYLLGTHDFTSFRAADCQSNSPIKTVDYINLWREGDYILFEISAKSFLHHQVRNIIGSLVNVGRGKWQPEKIPELIKAKDRKQAGMTAPAAGLYLTGVDY